MSSRLARTTASGGMINTAGVQRRPRILAARMTAINPRARARQDICESRPSKAIAANPVRSIQPILGQCIAQEPEGQDHQGDQDIGHQLAGVPGNTRQASQAGGKESQRLGAGGQAMAAEQKADQPEGAERLHEHRPPEGLPAQRAQPEKKAVKQRTSRNKLHSQDGIDIAAGIVKGNGIAVPQGRGQQGGEAEGQINRPAQSGSSFCSAIGVPGRERECWARFSAGTWCLFHSMQQFLDERIKASYSGQE